MLLKPKRFVLTVLATLLTLNAGCASFQRGTGVPFEFRKPTFHVKPKVTECQIQMPNLQDGKPGPVVKETCITLLARDFGDVLAELEATCAATGLGRNICEITGQTRW